MKTTLLSFSIVFLCLANTQLIEIRELYFSKANTEEGVFFLGSALEKAGEGVVIDGYRAALKIILSKNEKSPFVKLKKFNEGKIDLEAIILDHSNNIELRLIRLSIQDNTPSIVNYRSNTEEDRMFLMNKKDSLKEEDLKNKIETYLAER
jgi:hypothetical protein